MEKAINFKIFGKWDVSNIEIHDIGLKRYICLKPMLMPKTYGRARQRFSKANVNIVERLINMLQVPGHRGKKHKIMTHWATGKFNKKAKAVIECFKIIEERTKQNPIQVLINAIENAAPHDEITTIEYGGARYPQAVDTSPQRRLSIALRNIVHGAYDKCFDKAKSLPEALADEIIAAANNSNESFAITKKIEIEKQADSAR